MKYCEQEGSNFPAKEFEKVKGIWIHKRPGEAGHVAERLTPGVPKRPLKVPDRFDKDEA